MLCPWADVLYAMDLAWWKKYIAQVRQEFNGLLITQASDCFGVPKSPAPDFGNSGAGAIALAAECGATTIYLLGYDCQHTGGKKHWHGDHPAGLGNAGMVAKWPSQFAAVAQRYRHASIINCSRQTSLRCFSRALPDQVLQV